MSEQFAAWNSMDYIHTKEDICLYLEACAEEDPGDGSLIRVALDKIIRTGNVSQLAREVEMSREGLYKAFSAAGNPSLATLLKVTRALGLKIQFTFA